MEILEEPERYFSSVNIFGPGHVIWLSHLIPSTSGLRILVADEERLSQKTQLGVIPAKAGIQEMNSGPRPAPG